MDWEWRTNGSILIWEVETRKSVPLSFKGHVNAVHSVIFAPDSETFASASNDKTVCIWKRETGETVLGPFKVDTPANSVSYSPDGRKLAAGTNRHIIVWNTANGKELLKIEQRAYRVAFTPDGLRLVSGDDKDIRISDAITGDRVKQFDAHTDTLFSLAIAPSGTKFATTSFDNTTRFFDLTTFKPIGEPLGHPHFVWGVAFSEDSQLIATGCWDNLVRTWMVPESESEMESQQSALKVLQVRFHARHFVPPLTSLPQKTIPDPKPRRERAGLSRGFFDDFDARSTPRRNNHSVPTGSRIKKIMNRLLFRSPAPQDHTNHPHRIPVVDVFATRGKYRTVNATSGKRHLLQPPRPPCRKAQTSNAGAPKSSAPPAETYNVISGATSAALQTGGAGASAATNRPPSPVDVERGTEISCLALLVRYFFRLSQTRQTHPAASRAS
ncbi:WD40-repeat-containing domain protein [Suillus paluster]|uniref:WD40-repeat-containing domain protein n=1 Tax=Suillus paluster TaxID=48578 RepID=UPI001B860FE8|nr:WD40-repeat-containing domain protein [Suillus paluster]KAG1728643.1 WD40-repeat-containing domain protein [Suillus paluster]